MITDELATRHDAVGQHSVIKVLLVDDNEMDRRLIKAQLRKSRLRADIEEASDGAEGIERAIGGSFDCILLDYQLPDMKGTEVLQALSASLRSGPLAIIVLSGRGDENTAAESIKLGAQDYLVKGATTPTSIERAIGNAIEKAELVNALQIERHALAMAHADLEKKVEERTRDLLETNLRLEKEIDQRVRSEEALRASEKRYQDLYDNSPDMLVSVEPELGHVVGCNATLADALDVAKDSIIGGSVFELYDSDCVARARSAFRSFVDTGQMRDVDFSIRRSDASMRDISQSATAYRSNSGSINYVRLSWRDVTERNKLAEETRRHHSELAHVARLSTLGEMASGLAHELNQPLTAITNYCDLAVELSNDGCAAAEIAPMLEKASSQAHHAGHIIRRLRALVRKSADEVTCSNLNTAIREAAAVMEAGAREKQVVLVQILDDGLPPVFIDRIQIQQVILNLLRNGIEAVHSGSGKRRQVSIESRRDLDDNVVVTVRDTGPGIDAQLWARIFHPFETTKSDGMGLGLSISRSIVEAHGGRLWAEPDQGKGAIFSLSLPLKRGNES